jgi:hypothetical protein
VSKWRAIALAGLARRENAHEIRVPLVSLVPIGPAGGANGTIGTAPEIDLDERLAMALAGGVPAVYAEALPSMMPGASSTSGDRNPSAWAGRRRCCLDPAGWFGPRNGSPGPAARGESRPQNS